ncbi:XRE family transcriptional regulator [Mediterraneibacter gnavus]|jgi:transcriptional regulator with XRE-family HTH domain|uniref:XRE family transcriptional regulator n=1 Tax=Mediterraneibacter gnavus TaxID=33038 RepID=A0A415SDM9_MEDGN|nr:helix-turn-helix transcriptional regulator [Mediterraneibacter gnavus]RHM81386.1 XRE family transcriptional regulator [Mediterraneibacter gnavus]
MCFESVECGKRISALRAELGMSQTQAAEKLNISVQHYRAVESGRRGASIDLLMDISVAYHTSLDYLVMGKTHENDLNMMKEKLKTIIQCLQGIEKAL